jgi:hypothetical protein
VRAIERLSVVACIVAAPSLAHAAASVRLSVSAERAEQGEGIRVELSAMSDDESPSNPRLRVPPGFTVQGPSVGSSHNISFSNGHFEHRRGITATWVVVAPKTGRFVLGPALVQVGSSAAQSETVTVEIVAPGTIPRRPRRNPFDPLDPFDPFSGMRGLPGFPNLDDFDPSRLPGNLPPVAPPEYAVEHAPDQLAFLRATASPADAVVGQQVTLRIYAYGARGYFDEVGSSEPSRADFLSQDLVDGNRKQPLYPVEIDGERWTAVKVREIALFPLRAGDLTIGSMKMGFHGAGYPEATPMQGLVRASPELHIAVREPPLAGRPPGYELGNVGSYTLNAEVEPRSIIAGDAIAVTIKVSGTGNVPHAVKVPEQKGVDWLDPTVTDAMGAHNSIVDGSRTIRYVVRLDEAGTRDLGEVTLPYYDPRTRRYETARATLGSVEVKPGKVASPVSSAAPAPAKASAEGPLEDIGAPRKALGEPARAPRHFTDSKGYFGLLAGGPLAVLALGGLAELAGRLKRRFALRRQSLSTASKRALMEAREGASRGDRAAVAGGVERALYTAIEDKLGLKARAVLRDSLREKLVQAGADGTVSAEIVDILGACDALRFAGGDDANGVIDRASSAVSRLPRVSRATIPEQAA